MRKAGKWVLRVVAGLASLALLAVIVIFAVSEYELRKNYDPAPDPAFRLTSGDPIEGERLARVYGCSGCHGKNLQGQLLFDEPAIATVHTANLTRVIPTMDNADFLRAMREGVRRDGTAMFVMPSSRYRELSPPQLSDILAFLRSIPLAGPEHPEAKVGPLGRIGLMLGEAPLEPKLVEQVKRDPLATIEGHEAGRAIAIATCGTCHGMKLEGDPASTPKTPNLTIAAAYDREDFETLMRTGKAAGNRELRLMSEVARNHFSAFTDAEIDALHAYLVARAAAMPPE